MDKIVDKKEKILCHDCKCEIKAKGDKILNGKYLVYEIEGVRICAIKCNKCYKKDKSLKNFQECEVYSRIVGYYRPITSWNESKQEEYGDRKNFELKRSTKRK